MVHSQIGDGDDGINRGVHADTVLFDRDVLRIAADVRRRRRHQLDHPTGPVVGPEGGLRRLQRRHLIAVVVDRHDCQVVPDVDDGARVKRPNGHQLDRKLLVGVVDGVVHDRDRDTGRAHTVAEGERASLVDVVRAVCRRRGVRDPMMMAGLAVGPDPVLDLAKAAGAEDTRHRQIEDAVRNTLRGIERRHACHREIAEADDASVIVVGDIHFHLRNRPEDRIRRRLGKPGCDGRVAGANHHLFNISPVRHTRALIHRIVVDIDVDTLVLLAVEKCHRVEVVSATRTQELTA